MLLAVDVGNTYIDFGVFSDHCLATNFRIAADRQKSAQEYAVSIDGLFRFYEVSRAELKAAILSSVVPRLTDTVAAAIKELIGVDAMVVGKGIKTGFSIKIDNPAELGADLVANAAAVLDMLKKENRLKTPCVIVDMGTATTIFAINTAGEYIGGSILPGVEISLEALHGNADQLPTVSPTTPTRAIGKNSCESVRSGVLLGHAMMIDGFIDRFAKEMRCKNEPDVFVTGEYANTVLPFCTHSVRTVPTLTLYGLACIYFNNFGV